MHWNASRDQRREHEEAGGWGVWVTTVVHIQGVTAPTRHAASLSLPLLIKQICSARDLGFVFPRESKLHQTSCNVSLFLCFLPWEPNVLHHCFKHLAVLLLWVDEKAGGWEQSRVQARGEFLKSQHQVKQLFSHWYWSIIQSTPHRNVASFPPTDTEKKRNSCLFIERGKQDKRR